MAGGRQSRNVRVVSHLRLLPSAAPRMTPDEACLEAFQRELNYVYRTLQRMGTPRFEIEDLMQEVFVVLRRSWTEYDPARPLRPYLFGIMFRMASAHYRKRKREVAIGDIDLDDTRPGPDEMLQSKQERAMVLAALEGIPLPRRAVLIMHELDDVPIREIASVLGIPLFTAYSRLRKAHREFEALVRGMLREADAG